MSNWAVLTSTAPVGGALLTNTSTSRGTAVIYGAGSGAQDNMGSWVEVSSALPFTCVALVVYQTQMAYYGMSFDVGVGAGGSEQVVVNKYSMRAGYDTKRGSIHYVPIAINRGQRVAIRASCANIWQAPTGYMAVQFVQPSWLTPYGGSYIGALGDEVANDSGGAANTFSSWNQATAATSRAIIGLVVSHYAAGGDATADSMIWQVGVGAGGSEVVVGSGVTERLGYYAGGSGTVIPVSIPSGTRIAYRHQCNSTASGSQRNLLYRINVIYR